MIRKIISLVLFLVLVFFYLYPTGMPIYGYSFIFLLGLLGIGLYAYNQFPYAEVIPILLVYGAMFVWSYFCTFINKAYDSFIIDYTKSQMGWFFSAYLLIYLFYKIFPKGGIHIIIYYIIAAIFIQCVISVAMYMDPGINEFFSSLQKHDGLAEYKKAQTEGSRLIGYGTAFFGAGIACGFALILIVYVLMTRKWNVWQLLLISAIYCSIFYVGMLSARTTMVGMFTSIGLLVVFLFTQNTHKKQVFSYLIFSVILLSIGYTLSYIYFPDFADWAFEAFINYRNKGELMTLSSSGLSIMFVLPQTAFEWIFGMGIGQFMFTDVGFSRLLLWFGLPGTLLYFYYQIMLIKPAFTRNRNLDLLLITFFVYNLVLNYKGLSDLNPYILLFTFYFLYYKYYIYTPYLYRLGKFNQTKLRYAVQTSTASRRVQGNV